MKTDGAFGLGLELRREKMKTRSTTHSMPDELKPIDQGRSRPANPEK
jgi:hypothetical protein